MAKEKDAYYFSHDSNARNDDRIIAMRMRHGMEGYGIYWAIVERLRECSEYTSVKDYNVISFDLRTSAEKVKSIIEDFGLFTFTDDGKRFYSDSLNRRMIFMNERSGKARDKAKKRWENAKNMLQHTKTDATALLQHTKTDAIKGNEIKGNESSNTPSIFQIDIFMQTALSDEMYFKAPLIQQQKHNGLTQQNLPEWMAAFNAELKSNTDTNKSEQDYRAHFKNWLRKRLEGQKQTAATVGIKSFAAQVIANKQQNG